MLISMRNKVLIKINCKDINEFTIVMFNHHIDFSNTNINNNCIYTIINSDDIDIISKLYNVEVIKYYNIKKYLYLFKTNIFNIILIILGLIFINIFSNIIIEVNVLSSNLELVTLLNKSLDKYNIKRLSFKKNYIELQTIKEKLSDEFNEKIEWLEIENVGMTYNIKLEERKVKSKDIIADKCNVVATTDGTISKIISSSGVVLVKKNQLVKEGDLLIDGQIKLNEEVKKDVCASGYVYAEKWYSIKIEVPKTYHKKKYSGKFRYNVLLEFDNRDFKIFKSRLKDYDTDKMEVISLLNKKIYLLKEYEFVDEVLEYDENSLNKRIDELISEKLELSLSDKEKIISKNILHKFENDSKINIELFVTVEKLISKQVTF